MTRLRWVGLAVAAVLVAAALVLPKVLGDDASAPVVSQKTRDLQARAALAPCPTGLGSALPDLTVRCLGGGPSVRLSSPLSTGTPTVVNVWGSWCAPCQREIPGLIRFARAAQGRVALVGVVTADVDDFALNYAGDVGMHYASVVDDDAKISLSFGQGVPKSVFLDATGKVMHVESGELTYERLVALVKQHLGVTV